MEFFVWRSDCFKRIEKEKRAEIRLFFFFSKFIRTENGYYTDTSVLRKKRCYDKFTETKKERRERVLQYIAKKSTDFLFAKTEIDWEEREIYTYGFELFWSTFLSLSSMIVLAVIFGYVPQMIIFTLFFLPIRMTAGGAHASSYRNCWCLSNLVAVGCVVVGNWLDRLQLPKLFSAALLIIVVGYIWREAPVRWEGESQRKEIIERNRRYSHVILVAEAVMVIIFVGSGNGRMYYTAAIASYIVAIMIWIAIKGERRKHHE